MILSLARTVTAYSQKGLISFYTRKKLLFSFFAIAGVENFFSVILYVYILRISSVFVFHVFICYFFLFVFVDHGPLLSSFTLYRELLNLCSTSLLITFWQFLKVSKPENQVRLILRSYQHKSGLPDFWQYLIFVILNQ